MPLPGGLSPFPLAPSLDVFPIVHGKAPFAMAVRRILWERRLASLALAFPAALKEAALEVVEKLPRIHAAAVWLDGKLAAYLPADPCDAYVEGIRQALSRRMSLEFLEGNARLRNPLRYVLPDANLLPGLGAATYRALAKEALEGGEDGETAVRAQRVFSAWKRMPAPSPTLLLCDFPLFFALEKLFTEGSVENALAEAAATQSPDAAGGEEENVAIRVLPVKPGQLYFALGELPHYAGELEKERQNPLAEPRSYFDLVKSLFIGTRSGLLRDPSEAAAITLKKVQTALTFTRNLAAIQASLTPGLLEIVAAARGVFGHAFAARLLEAARAYPFAEAESPDGWLEVGKDSIRLPDGEPEPAFNLLADEPKVWKAIRLRRDADKKKQRRYRYLWDARGLCSHVPEDIRIERFNRAARAKGRESIQHGEFRSEPLTASLKDGIDVRETLRNFAASGRVHVREIPPQRGNIDTVVILFDEDHDSLYPFRMAWSYEHAEESMLTFYGTEPFDDMVGPGIARARFGGLSLLFPPRPVSDVFKLPAAEFGFRNLAEQLVFGALKNSGHKSVALVSDRRPGLRLRRMAAGFRRRLAWVPMNSFSAETVRRLRSFHVLNGQKVRAWAARFIEE